MPLFSRAKKGNFILGGSNFEHKNHEELHQRGEKTFLFFLHTQPGDILQHYDFSAAKNLGNSKKFCFSYDFCSFCKLEVTGDLISFRCLLLTEPGWEDCRPLRTTWSCFRFWSYPLFPLSHLTKHLKNKTLQLLARYDGHWTAITSTKILQIILTIILFLAYLRRIVPLVLCLWRWKQLWWRSQWLPRIR